MNSHPTGRFVIHPYQADVHQVVGTGISLMAELTSFPRHLLDMAFNDIFLRRNLQLHHVGLLVPLCSYAEILSAIGKHGFRILSIFPSSVVASQLSQRFDTHVDVDIYRTCSASGGAPTLEIFRVANGLDAESVYAAMPDVMHVAYVSGELVDAETVSEKMAADGFEFAGGGINHDDTTPNGDGVTVLYFHKRQLTGEIPKIELVLYGAHELTPISAATNALGSTAAFMPEPDSPLVTNLAGEEGC